MREYQPIWEQLKRKGTVVIRCHADHKATIKKAVIKEKNMDEVYKLQYRRRLKVTYTDTGLVFTLQDYTPLSWILSRHDKRKGTTE